MQRGPLVLFVIAAFLGGTAAGVLGRDALRSEPVEPPTAEAALVAPQLTEAQLALLCGEKDLGELSLLQAAQAEAGSLRGQLEAREVELAALRVEQERSKEAGQRLAEKMRALETEVAQLRTRLVEVTAERDELLVELKSTVKELEHQIRETERYKAQARKWKRKSTENLWRSFIAETKVEICDRGTVKRHERCHEAVEEALASEVQDRFEHCVDTRQAIPALAQLPGKGADLPEFAEALPDDRRFTTKRWYIQFCDPTLPEATEGERG